MAAKKATSVSIADIEKQIAKVSAELEKARAQQLTNAEKARLAAQKAASASAKKLADLRAKGASTAAAKSRLEKAKAEAAEHNQQLVAATEVANALRAEKKSAAEMAKTISRTLGKPKASTAGKKTKPVKTAKQAAPAKITPAKATRAKTTAVPAADKDSQNAAMPTETKESKAKTTAKKAATKTKPATASAGKKAATGEAALAVKAKTAKQAPAAKAKASVTDSEKSATPATDLIKKADDQKLHENKAAKPAFQAPEIKSEEPVIAVPTPVIAEKPLPSHTTVGMIEPRDTVLPKPTQVPDAPAAPFSGNLFERDDKF